MADKIVIDAKNAILGRLSSYAAKQVLLGNDVDIINCDECVVTGNDKSTLREYTRKLHRKAPTKGPYFYKRPDMFVKRAIRGMLPFKKSRGRVAFKNIKCYTGIPEGLQGQKAFVLESAGISKLQSSDYLKVKEICKAVGGKQ